MRTHLTHTTLYRVQPLLFTVFGFAACQFLLFIVLPLQLRATGHPPSAIGFAMSMFAFGAIFAGLFGAKVISHIGHIRAFSFMAACSAIITVLHSFYDALWLTAVLRALTGYAAVVNFMVLESWLNVITDKSNRGKIFSVYQIALAMGGISAPFVLSSFTLSDPKLFGLMACFLSISIMILSATKLPVPEISEKTNALSLNKLWNISPSGIVSAFCSGLITSVSISLFTLYTAEKTLPPLAQSMILSAVLLGGLLTQYPTGWFADRFDKRTVAATLMCIGALFNGLIIIDAYWSLPLPLLIFSFLISAGSAAALFPLAITQVFDHIDLKDAVRVTGTLQVILGIAGFIGPIIAGYLMDVFNTMSLFFYIAGVHIFVVLFLLIRKLFIRQERLPTTYPFQVTTQQTALTHPTLDPHTLSQVSKVGDPELKLLLLALAQEPKDPGILIQAALDSARLHPIDIAIHLVTALPKQSQQLITELVRLYPEARLEIAHSLSELMTLRKSQISQLLNVGLSIGANPAECSKIEEIIQSAQAKIITKQPNIK